MGSFPLSLELAKRIAVFRSRDDIEITMTIESEKPISLE
jgi:hypothetical protein